MLKFSSLARIPIKSVLKLRNAHSQELLLLIDGLYRIRYISPSVEALGYSVKELTGKNVEEMFKAEDLDLLKASIEGMAGQKEPEHLRIHLIDSNGDMIGHEGTLADHTQDGSICCHVLLLRRAGDTPQNAGPLSTAGVAADRTGIQRTIANFNEGFFTLDHDSRFISVNQITERLARIPREQLLGRKIWEVFPVDPDHPFYKLLRDVRENKVFGSSTIYSTTFNAWFTIRAFPHTRGISVIHNDVGGNGEKKNEDLLLANERYRLATQLTDEAHWDWDPLTNEVQWGEGLNQFGYDPAALNGNMDLLYQLIHPEDIPRLIGSLQHAFEDPSIVLWDDKYRLKRADGEYVFVRSRGSVIRDANNTPIRMVGSLRDISREHEAARQKDLLHKVTFALAASPDVGSGMEQMLGILCRYTGYVVGEMWLLDEFERNMMPCGHHVERSEYASFSEFMQGRRIFPGEGLPGTAWKEDQFLHWTDLQENDAFIRRKVAGDLGITEGLAFPIRYGGQVIAMITLFSDRPMQFHEGDLELLDAIAMHIAPEVKKRRAEKDLHNFFAHTRDLLFIMDPEGRIYKHNPAFSTEMGYDVNDLWGTHFLDHVHPDDVQMTLQASTTISKDQNVSYLENRIRCADGSYRWIAWTTTFADKDGIIYCTGKDITARKQDETHLFEVTQRLFDFKESITDALCMFDQDWKFTYVNHECQKLLRRSYGELIDQSLWEMFPDAVGTEFERQYKEAVTSGKAVHFESYFPPLASWFEVHAYPSLTGLSVFFRDITESHMLNSYLEIERQALSMNMTRSRPLAEILDTLLLDVGELVPGMHSAILTVDPCGQTLSPISAPTLPDAYLRMTRAFPIKEGEGSLGTAAARKSIVIVTDILADPLWDKYRAAAAPFGLRACWSYPVISSSGTLLAVLSHYFGEPREPGPVERLLSERLTHTITVLIESHRTEEAIRISNERYGIISKATNDVTWDWDVNTNAIIWGERVWELFGIEPDSENSDLANWTRRIHPEDTKATLQSLDMIIQDRTSVKWEHEYRLVRDDGSIAHVLDRGYVIRDPNGVALRMVGAMMNMTDRKEKELALQDLNDKFAQRTHDLETSNAELERFAYMVSHDLQEPLRMIGSFMQLLEKKHGAQLDDKAREYITFAVDGAERMKRLIRDLLEYSRIDIDPGNFTQVDMSALAHQVRNMFMKEIETSGAVIECEGLHVITANRTHMLQLLQNLMDNALKYRSEAPPRIKLTALEHEDHWEFQVADNGVGVNERHFEKIFIIFHRLNNGADKSGTGLGLAVCKKIIEKHQGRIWISSLLGKGSTIHFTIAKDPVPANKRMNHTH